MHLSSKRLFLIALIVACSVSLSACQSNSESDSSTIENLEALFEETYEAIPERQPHPDVPLKGLVKDDSQLWIFIDKTEREISLMSGHQPLKTYPMVLGFNPKDDKRREGDGCTPEGEFKVRAKYPHKNWSKFIWIDYPTAASHRKYQAAVAKGEITKGVGVGGEIGIHGVPDGRDDVIDKRDDWTLGCISLKNAHINELYPYVRQGMRIKISP